MQSDEERNRHLTFDFTFWFLSIKKKFAKITIMKPFFLSHTHKNKFNITNTDIPSVKYGYSHSDYSKILFKRCVFRFEYLISISIESLFISSVMPQL